MREIPRSRLHQRGPGVLAGVRPNLRSCFCTPYIDRTDGLRARKSWVDEASVQLLPQTTARRALSLGSVKSPAPGGNMRARDGAGRPRGPQGSGGAGGVGDTRGPLQARSIPCARSPVRRWVLWPWALPPGLGALSPARPGMLPR
uniref:Uncharacterized protein n=1 Tax=Saimiri boliviensis boliviensis TaxID=39432 RepID=A0A2K6UWA5_SAIBB